MALFEELAARLATSSDPRDRARAAEELAGLDDPRVAPALARALADADAAVRQRVEELLSQFCRRDKTGHLQLLLAEAERVSEALAAEVERLRGESPLAGEPATVEPIAPPEGYDGPCALIRLAPATHDIQRFSRRPGALVGQDLCRGGVANVCHSIEACCQHGLFGDVDSVALHLLQEPDREAGREGLVAVHP